MRILLALLLIFSTNVEAALTIGQVPRVKTGGATPSLENGSISDTGNIGIGTIYPQGKLVVTGGNVGIGTISPVEVLQVIGNLKVSGTITGTLSPSTLTVSGDTLLATTSGNVGIGTTAPQGKFVVSTGNVGIGTWVPINPFQVGNTSTTGVAITSVGNVGIGSSAPQSRLDVFGSMRVINSGHITTEGVTATGATGSGKFVFDGTPTLVTPVIGAATGTSLALTGNIGLGGGGVTSNALQVTGNVGIGTTIAVNGVSILGKNVGIGTWSPTAIIGFGTTGNIGIGTFGAAAATCDSVCNTTNARRCFMGTTTTGIPTACSVTISGTCVCLAK